MRLVKVFALSWCAASASVSAQSTAFVRGDANADGSVDIADGVRTLVALFRESTALQCEDAADSDDNGRIELNDAVYTFNYLFADGPAPPGRSGCCEDKSPDELDCATFDSCSAQDTLRLKPIGNKDVDLGSTLEFWVDVEFDSSSPPIFTVQPLPLPPNVRFHGDSGLFIFHPSATQIGSFSITFSVDDGCTNESETILITVHGPRDGQTTSISGRILDTADYFRGDQTPVVGATISLLRTGRSARSDASGLFLLDDVPSGSQILDIDTLTAELAADGSRYAAFREELEIIEGVENTFSRPILLPRTALESVTLVNPTGTTVVRNPSLGVELTVADGAAQFVEDGAIAPYLGELSVSEVPGAMAPVPLPEGFDPGLLITIQPVGVIFDPPAQLTYPNIDELPVGTSTDIWSLDPETGTFTISGSGLVVDDGRGGTVIQTVAGGVRRADWHFIIAGLIKLAEVLSGEDCKVQFGSQADLVSGSLIVEHELAAYRSLDHLQSLRFVYNSKNADPRPVLNFDVTVPHRSAVPKSVSLRLQLAGVDQAWTPVTLTEGLAENSDNVLRQSYQVDARLLSCGAVRYRAGLDAHFTRSSVCSFRRGILAVNNQIASPYGAGWTIEGVARLCENRADDLVDEIVILEGDGSESVFRLEEVPIDLRDWTDEGDIARNLWRRPPDGDPTVVHVPGHGDNPIFLVSPDILSDGIITGTFRVQRESDFIGLVFGYTKPRRANGDPTFDFDFFLFDWKGKGQTHLGFRAEEGYSLSRVRGRAAFPWPIFWGHNTRSHPLEHVMQLIATDWGEGKGWRQATEHRFELEYSPNRVRIRIDGEVIFEEFGLFPPGRFGFYNFSQQGATYRAFKVDPTRSRYVGPPGDFSRLFRQPDGSFRRVFKDGVEIHFDPNGLQTRIIDRNGNTTSFSYNGSGALARIVDPVGLETVFEYAGSRLADVVDPAGRRTQFEIDRSGDLIAITDPDGTTRRFAYREHRMVSQASKRGNTTEYSYDRHGKVRRVKHPDGTTREITHVSSVVLDRFTNGAGTRAKPAQHILAADVLAEHRDGKNQATRFRGGAVGAASRYTDPRGGEIAIVRNRDLQPVSITDLRGARTTFKYDSSGNPTQMVEADGTTLRRQWGFTYESRFSQVTGILDPKLGFTKFQYDDRGNLQTLTNPLMISVSMTYDDRGLLETFTDERGNPTSFTYDLSGNLETVTTADETVTKVVRDVAGNELEVIEGLGTPAERLTAFTYDALNRVKSVTDGEGAVTTYTYDEDGQMKTVTTPTGEPTTAVYDSMGRLERIEDPISGRTVIRYDENGSVKCLENSLGRRIELMNDEVGNPIEVKKPEGIVELYTYDLDGGVRSFTNGEGRETKFEYDDLGRLVLVEDPLDQMTRYRYDSLDNLISYDPPGSLPTTFEYDPLSRLTVVRHPDNVISYGYDDAGNLELAQDADSRSEFTFDELNRLVDELVSLPGGSAPLTLTNIYDEVGNRVGLRDSRGLSVEWRVDRTGRMREVRALEANLGLDYDPTGRLTQIRYPNALLSDYRFDALGRLESIAHARDAEDPLGQLAFTYTALGWIDTITESERISDFEYDDVSRLTRAGTVADPEIYAYDRAGNLKESPRSSDFTYDAADQIADDGVHTYEFDLNGNLAKRIDKASGGTTAFTYDAANRLVRVAIPDGRSVSFRYDAFGRRVEKSFAGEIRRYVYDGLDLIAELDSENNVVARYVYGPFIDQPLMVESGGTCAFYHGDHQGSVRLLTAADGRIVNSYEYNGYGGSKSAIEAFANPFRFTGREWDAETGLYYYRARYYDPEIGRFLTRDPSGFEGGSTNLYAYVDGNPANLNDPSGRVVQVVAVGLGSAIVLDYVIQSGLADLRREGHHNVAKYLEAIYNATGIVGVARFARTLLTLGRAGLSLGRGILHLPRQAWRGVKNLGTRFRGELGPVRTGGAGAAKAAATVKGPATWANSKTLADHFARHGKDFGAKTAQEYSQAASDFLRRSQGQRLPTKIGPDGTIRVYDPQTNTFGSYTAGGGTRTFYKPDPAVHGYKTNLDYWNAQPGTSP
jgi:RHS repeat-associated protein